MKQLIEVLGNNFQVVTLSLNIQSKAIWVALPINDENPREINLGGKTLRPSLASRITPELAFPVCFHGKGNTAVMYGATDLITKNIANAIVYSLNRVDIDTNNPSRQMNMLIYL